jgi:hypothetical protein
VITRRYGWGEGNRKKTLTSRLWNIPGCGNAATPSSSLVNSSQNSLCSSSNCVIFFCTVHSFPRDCTEISKYVPATTLGTLT